MKKARLILSASMLSIAAFSAITFTSCSKDDKDCAVGYEGDDCDVESRTKFIKTWSAVDNVNGTDLVYTCNIAKGSTINKVIISNTFSDNFFANNINATVDGNTITIAEQTPDGVGDSGFGYSVSGSGTYTGGQISWNYLIIRNADGDELSHTGVWE